MVQDTKRAEIRAKLYGTIAIVAIAAFIIGVIVGYLISGL